MKRIVWLFGDGSTQFTAVDPQYRREGETEEEQIERIKAKCLRGLAVSPVACRYDLRPRNLEEQRAYAAALGVGATPTFAGIIDGGEFEAKHARLREYREAWTWTTPEPVIDLDMARCREIKRHQLRRLRGPQLEALDTQYLRALERGDAAEQAAIAAQKQALRDVTADPAIDAAHTPEELQAVMPAALRETVTPPGRAGAG
jgi:hypothetical protein